MSWRTPNCAKCKKLANPAYADNKNNGWYCEACEEKRRKKEQKEQKQNRYPHLDINLE